MAEEKEESKKGKSKLTIILAALVLLLIVGGAGAFFMMSKETVEEPVVDPLPSQAVYTKVHTPEGRKMFLVSLPTRSGGTRLMQIYLEAKTRDQESADLVTLHMPLIVAQLNSLFSSYAFEDLLTYDDKVKMKEEAKRIVQSIVKEKSETAEVVDLMFTDLVIQ